MPFTAYLNGNTVLISSFTELDRGKDFRCKLCNEKMTLVFSSVYSNHFRHLVSSCGNYETIEHLMMKKTLSEWLNKFNYTYEIEALIIDDREIKNIIDILVDKGKTKIAIECQHSKLSYWEADLRTRNLNKKGFFVLWVLDHLTFASNKVTDLEKFLHRIYFGRVYYLLHNRLRPIHFVRVKRYNDYKDYYYTLKRTRKKILGKIIDKPLFLLKTVTDIKTKEKYKIAMFNEKKFW